MGKCIYSHGDGAYCDRHDHGAVTVGCCGEGKCPDRKALTNADRIRAMTDEKMANFLIDVAVRGGIQTDAGAIRWTILDWLKQEVSTNG